MTTSTTAGSLDGHVLAAAFARVQRPGRYLGGEVNLVRKDWATTDVKVALAFPDVYEVAMSHFGLAILYRILNDRPDTLAERCYAPWPDMEAELRRRGLPLYSLETRHPLAAFDLVGFSLQFELCYPTVLAMLDQGGIPVRSRDRGDGDAIVLAGGPCAFNPEPLADFLDVVVLGDGEEVFVEIVETTKATRGRPRRERLGALARIPGCYVPQAYDVAYHPDGTIAAITRRADWPEAPERVVKRVIADLDRAPFPEKPLVPNVAPVHPRLPLELQRGCTRACRFCQAGMIARPTRQRSPETVFRMAMSGLQATGNDEVGFLSLSAGDYGCLNPLLEDFFRRYAPERVAVSLPSLRTETLTPELAGQIKKVRKTGFTIAPEAGSARMRRVINKGNEAEDLLEAVRTTFRAGWGLVKMYFMIGLPTERDEDIRAIAELCAEARRVGRAEQPGAELTCSVSTHVPKPHTPFQWAAQCDLDEVREKQRVLFEAFRSPKLRGVSLKMHESQGTLIEGLLSRGDRRLGDVIEEAWRSGCRLDGWTEHFSLPRWQAACARHGLDIKWYLRERGRDEILPWEHLDSLLSKSFLWSEWNAALQEAYVADCALESPAACYMCGVCDHRVVKNRVYHEATYTPPEPEPEGFVPEVKLRRRPASAQATRRVRVRFGKHGDRIFLGHLDTVDAIAWSLRRAGIALAYSEGYHPKPKMQLTPATPVGVLSDAEYLDLTLAQPMDAEEVRRRLSRALPEGLPLLEVTALADGAPGVNELLDGVVYRIELPAGAPDPAATIASLREAGGGTLRLLVQREQTVKPPRGKGARGKGRCDGNGATELREIDFSHTLAGVEVTGPREVRVELRHAPTGMPRPAELLRHLLGLNDDELVAAARVRKEATLLRAPAA